LSKASFGILCNQPNAQRFVITVAPRIPLATIFSLGLPRKAKQRKVNEKYIRRRRPGKNQKKLKKKVLKVENASSPRCTL